MSGTACRAGFLLLVLGACMILDAAPMAPSPANAQGGCNKRGGYWGQNNYVFELYMHPGWACTEFFHPTAQIVSGGSRVPACGRFGYTQGRPGFTYQAGNSNGCHDLLTIRIQMPDKGLWDYHFWIAVFPPGFQLPAS